MVKKDYKVSGRIMIQDGTTSHIRRFKAELEHDGQIGDQGFELKILQEFSADIRSEMSQSKLPTAPDESPSSKPRKLNMEK